MQENSGVGEKLDAIIAHLDRMDRRDRLRTWGSFIRTLISLVPMLLFLWSLWYFASHVDDIIKKITQESAKAAAQYTEDKSGELMKQIQNMLPKR